MNAVEKVVAILLAAVLLFICPIQIVAQKQDVVMQQYVTMETSYFIDSVRNLGYLSRQMYEEYKKKIDIGGTLYNVELTHYHMVYYDDSQAKDLVHRRYQCYYMQDIMDQIYDKDKDFTVSVNNMHSDCDHTIWEGKKLHGYPVQNYLRGNLVYDNGKFTGTPGNGKYVKRSTSK